MPDCSILHQLIISKFIFKSLACSSGQQQHFTRSHSPYGHLFPNPYLSRRGKSCHFLHKYSFSVGVLHYGNHWKSGSSSHAPQCLTLSYAWLTAESQFVFVVVIPQVDLQLYLQCYIPCLSFPHHFSLIYFRPLNWFFRDGQSEQQFLQLPFVCTVLEEWNCSWEFGRQTVLSNKIKVLVTCYCSPSLEELSCCFLLPCNCKWFIAENLKNTVLDHVFVAALIKIFTKLQHFLSSRMLSNFCKVL